MATTLQRHSPKATATSGGRPSLPHAMRSTAAGNPSCQRKRRGSLHAGRILAPQEQAEGTTPQRTRGPASGSRARHASARGAVPAGAWFAPMLAREEKHQHSRLPRRYPARWGWSPGGATGRRAAYQPPLTPLWQVFQLRAFLQAALEVTMQPLRRTGPAAPASMRRRQRTALQPLTERR